ncbi:MAG: bacteriohemerythrin [Myxococcales bacterium]
MGIEWNASYAVGIENIDQQHQELFLQISKLIDAMREARGKDEVAATLRFLTLYAQGHFEMEESLMAKHGYRAASDHRREHDGFRNTFASLASQLETEGPSSALALEVNNKVCNWLIRHVLGTDRPLAAYLRERGEK